MYNSIRILPSAIYRANSLSKGRQRSLDRLGLGLSAVCLCSLSMGTFSQRAYAQGSASDPAPTETTPANAAPAALTETLMQVDMAANQQDLPKLIGFYSPEFSDGSTKKNLIYIFINFFF